MANERHHNQRNHKGAAVTHDHNAIRDFYYYDDLDEKLRMVLQEFIGAFSSEHAWERCKNTSVASTLADMRRMELDDIMRFAGEYARKYKILYPHTAAFATIQRYGKKEATRQRWTARELNTLRRNKLMIEDRDGY